MICSRCGATNEMGQAFCYNCGTKLENKQEAPSYEQVPHGAADWSKQVKSDPYAVPSVSEPPFSYAPLPPGSPPGFVPVPVPTSTNATLSLIFGIVGWVALPFVGAIAAVVLGHMARKEIQRAGGRVAGDGLALAGLVLGYLQLVILFLAFCAFMFFFVLALGAGLN